MKSDKPSRIWTINGVRAHEAEADHTESLPSFGNDNGLVVIQARTSKIGLAVGAVRSVGASRSDDACSVRTGHKPFCRC